ncbi:hypothetical protein BBD42_30875 [Paenibacillus sp. BIHB 4019]|uniref:Uncharacterized protein n=1 Tax=Paenibacillus sp. BIHB 4019 TaxID=1870819 RepID=A0A1B2DRT1_9BACL|nr:hypothetical protein [Paenibacillus sp. BIHB 4019]ANY70411.1 hypothetical protein BBD42_30875 [Paenibacillus sp. BIHB 4019]
MREKQDNVELSEAVKLQNEKISLAKKLGIWQAYNPVEGYQKKKEYTRIKEIDQRLAEIVNG